MEDPQAHRHERGPIRQRPGPGAGRRARPRGDRSASRLHSDAFIRRFDSVRPLPGAPELLATLSQLGVPWAIATSGTERYARLSFELLGVAEDAPLITRDQVRYAKPDPDLFLTAAERIGVDITASVVGG